jgi:ATP-dependent Zn protease
VQRAALVVIAAWLLWVVVAALASVVTGSNFGTYVLQILLLGGYLLLFISFQLVLIYFFLARTRVYWLRPHAIGVRLRDYLGNPAAVAAAQRVVVLLQSMRVARAGGDDLVRGLLLSGPPGAGKRLLARAIAGEAGVPIGYLNATSLAVSRLGMSSIKVAMLYRKARRLAREYGACILLIDDIDAIGGASDESGAHAGGADWISSGGRKGVLGELLLQIDPPFRKQSWWRVVFGVAGTSGHAPHVLTIATTANPASLDASLWRPGRFDRHIQVALPNAEGRRELIRWYLSAVPHEPLPMERLAADTEGQPPAAIKRLVHEAVLYAYAQGRRAITYADIDEARNAHGIAAPAPPPAEPPPLPYAQQRCHAYYRAGQVYVRAHLSSPAVLHVAMSDSIASDEHGEQEASQWPAYSREELLAGVQVLLGGRAAEETFLGSPTTYAADDLQRATHLAALLVGWFGMDRWLLSYDRSQPVWGDAQDAEMHERTEAVLQREYSRVCSLLARNRESLALLAEALLLCPELNRDDLDELLDHVEARHPFVSLDADTPTSPYLVARRAPYREPGERSFNGRRFAEPEPALPDDAALPGAPGPMPPPVPSNDLPDLPDDEQASSPDGETNP